MGKILIVDDDQGVGSQLFDMARRMAHEAVIRSTLSDGLADAATGSYDVVFLDVQLPDGSGLDALSSFASSASSPEVIIMTGFGGPNGAEAAIRSGAWDYLQKPLSLSDVSLSLKRVFQYRENLRTLNRRQALRHEDILGSSRSMTSCLDLAAKAAQSDADVLITGETGTGKELFARAVHFNSSRAGGNLVVVDCAALPDTLIESALFGHEKGAFTGADKSKIGLVKQANRGALFLDEIGELPLALQKAFLRVLQERTFRPVGAIHEVMSDFRLIAATNRDLNLMVREGLFRSDLLFRLQTITIELPPLRHRPEDIPELVAFHASKQFASYGMAAKELSSDFMDALVSYHWPGNVRELVNTLRMVISTTMYEPVLFARHLPVNIRASVVTRRVKQISDRAVERAIPDTPVDQPSATLPRKYREFRDSILLEAEKSYLVELMAFTHGRMKEACELSGLSRTQLYNMLKRHGVSRLGWSR
jgi:two-component system NtrC family response regulator